MSLGSASDFDLMNALDWSNGIATLPGSQLQFRLSEFGTLEIITDSDKTLDSSANIQGTGKSVQRSTCTIPEQEMKKSEEKPHNVEKKEMVEDDEKKVGFSLEVQSATPTPLTEPAGPVTSTENERPQRLRKKRKLLMDSGDEEDPIEEDEERMRVYQKRGKTAKQVKAASAQKKKLWNWVSYLEEEKMPAAPLKLFKEHQSFPQSRNSFKLGLKLEGLDPEHPSLYCVQTVVEVQGYRNRLHFDGYPDCYDFWVNADSLDIHPVGWCEKTGHKLVPPKGYKDGEFSWPSYLKQCKAQAAPKTFFKSYNTPVTPSGFRVGMKLEAVDRKNPSLLCVATISDIVENRLLIHFDSWDHSYDYWCDASSPYIRPVGHCQEAGISLTPPPEFKDPKIFTWEAYLEKTGAQAAPARAFKVRPPHGFQPQMKLEAVDKRNPMLIRVCTVIEREENCIKLHFDGWSSLYDYWVDADSPDIHPVGWCAKTGHPLQLPPGVADTSPAPGQGCPIAGCKGIGHVRGPKYGTHYTAVGCPYSEVNLNREIFLQDRLSGERPLLSHHTIKARRSGTPNPVSDPPPDSPHSRKSPTDEQWGRGNMWEMAEWLDDEADTKPSIKKGAHTYIRLQLIKQETDGTDCELSLEQALHQSVFMTSLSSDPSHRIHLCWEKQCHLLPEVSAYTAKTVRKWNAEEVALFVQQLPGCMEQASVFREEQIDGEAFLLLTQTDLVKILGLKLGPALKIYNSILMFHNLAQN
ncbi:lethal(3)malignant brain tumor-like protein 3 [Bufo gargarizans]|uniref:lethal(3)malignant brain tumor-like protein 3 n=1 Tax=Bufo gargarizans TaxID=30331 RepID=UPI001CF2DDE9|nr:lethal(3)malignant brain tumor-like protein 3 [Bufo gargarizans]XP_044143803.1 lethal(3)malignant brain tumor-like protein 3 [Bufo gargarizans]